MTLTDWIRSKILKFLKIEHLNENPNDQRLTYISDNEEIYLTEMRTFKYFYIGNSSELLNWFTGEMAFGYAKNPLYNRNSTNRFWGLSSLECNIHRIHSGIPRAIITTFVSALGYPGIKVNDTKAISTAAIDRAHELNDQLCDILDKNDFKKKYTQEQMPLTLAMGDGAFKPIIDPDFADYPIWQYYDGENVEPFEKYGKVVGLVFKDYYKYNNKDYIKLETRRITKEGSVIEHELFKLSKNNDLIKVPLDTIPELANLKPLIIPGLNKILAVHCKFFTHPIYKDRGASIFLGKEDLFDFLDEIVSQLAQTNRVSTPLEYYNVDILERTKDGKPILPNRYNRQFVAKEGIPNGDGINNNKDIETTQPQLNYNQYVEAYKAVLDMILTGILSPATMGIEVAKKDNADAQREKEKITQMTGNNIIDSEEKILKEVCQLSLMLQEYLDTGKITIQDYDVEVKFQDIATPSFNQNLSVLGAARQAGNISNELYVDLLWGDTKTEAEKQEEIKRLNDNDSKDNYNLGNMFPAEPEDVNNESEDTTESDIKPTNEE